MLDTSVPLEYPVNVFHDVHDTCIAAEHDTCASLCELGKWEEALKFIEEHHHLINCSKLQQREEADNKTFLWTPLHWAASYENAGVMLDS